MNSCEEESRQEFIDFLSHSYLRGENGLFGSWSYSTAWRWVKTRHERRKIKGRKSKNHIKSEGEKHISYVTFSFILVLVVDKRTHHVTAQTTHKEHTHHRDNFLPSCHHRSIIISTFLSSLSVFVVVHSTTFFVLLPHRSPIIIMLVSCRWVCVVSDHQNHRRAKRRR